MAPRRRRVVWTERARRELDEAIGFISEDSVQGARRVLHEVLESAASLSTLGERGMIVPERGDPVIRELLVGSYRLLYRVSSDQIEILALLHQRQDRTRWRRADE
jgi:toxin ParE1/3/4